MHNFFVEFIFINYIIRHFPQKNGEESSSPSNYYSTPSSPPPSF